MKLNLYIAGLVGMLAAPSVFGSMTTTLLDNQNASTGYSYGDGGEFSAVMSVPNVVDWGAYSGLTSGNLTSQQLIDANATASAHGWVQAPSSLIGSQYFQTFCIQTAVTFDPGQSYNAVAADSITMGTAWLYSMFASGSLSGYNYTPYGTVRMNSAGSLQQAIWYFQGQSGGAANSFTAAAELALGGLSAALAESNGKYGVAGFDLSSSSGVAAQDQLVIVPETTTVVAGLLLLLPLGASTLRIVRQNRQA